jgi:thiaminase (transcriptional activator TenA)
LLLEWITLHDNPNFRGFVDFLRTELDSVGPADADLSRDLFSRAVELEFSFFGNEAHKLSLRGNR